MHSPYEGASQYLVLWERSRIRIYTMTCLIRRMVPFSARAILIHPRRCSSLRSGPFAEGPGGDADKRRSARVLGARCSGNCALDCRASQRRPSLGVDSPCLHRAESIASGEESGDVRAAPGVRWKEPLRFKQVGEHDSLVNFDVSFFEG